jgi:hypothetical protein
MSRGCKPYQPFIDLLTGCERPRNLISNSVKSFGEIKSDQRVLLDNQAEHRTISLSHLPSPNPGIGPESGVSGMLRAKYNRQSNMKYYPCRSMKALRTILLSALFLLLSFRRAD